MKLNLKAGESIRIANDHGTGFTFWNQGSLLQVTANPPEDDVVTDWLAKHKADGMRFDEK